MSGSRSRWWRGRHAGRPNRRRRGWRTWVGALAVILVLATGVWVLGFSSVLAVRQVTVEGARVLTEDEVVDIARVPIGVPLARIDTSGISDRVAELRPVREVKVSRSWPHTLRISVSERTAVFVVRDGGGFTVVDDTGVGFAAVGTPPDGLVVARDVPEDQWGAVAVVVGALPSTVAERAQSVTTRGPNAIVIHLAGDVRVEWGSADQSADKALVLSSLMTAAPEAKVYDVSAPHHPTTR